MKNLKIFLFLMAMLLTSSQAEAQRRKAKPTAPSAAPAVSIENTSGAAVGYFPNPLDLLGQSIHSEIVQSLIRNYHLTASEYETEYISEPKTIGIGLTHEHVQRVDIYEGYQCTLPLGLSFPLSGKQAQETAGKDVLQKSDDELFYETDDYIMYLELPGKSMDRQINYIKFVNMREDKPSADSQKPTDADYKKHFDLLLLYRFLANYLDSNRAEIKTEGGSVFYKTEARFPGTVDNYIEVKNGKGELKYVFYSGNDYAVATNKYAEIVGIAERLKEESILVSDEKYCEGCSGRVFRERINGENKPVRYWVQVINKPAGGWEVQLIYLMPLNKYYLKEAAKPAAATPAKTSSTEGGLKKTLITMDSIKAADKIIRAQAVQTALQEDFCTTLSRVIKEVPNNFETWKGAEKPEFFNMGKIWYTKYMIKGSIYATVQDDMLVSYNYWHCSLFEGPADFSKVLALYQGYVDQINACTQSCCTFTSSTKNSRDLGSAGQETIWKVSAVQPGNPSKYWDMKITIDFSLNTLNHEWYINMWVH